jgi:hypothetical protein
MNKYRVIIYEQIAHLLEVEANNEADAKELGIVERDEDSYVSSQIKYVEATLIPDEAEVEILHLQPDEDDLKSTTTETVGIDARCYGEVPDVSIVTIVHRDGKGQDWAYLNDTWYAVVDGRITLRRKEP